METKHTAEPLDLMAEVEGGAMKIVASDGRVFIHGCEADIARRIVAAVNVCAGIPTYMLEKFPLTENLLAQDRINSIEMKAQRDKLLALCKAALIEINATAWSEGVLFGPDVDIDKKLEAAIAEIEAAK